MKARPGPKGKDHRACCRLNDRSISVSDRCRLSDRSISGSWRPSGRSTSGSWRLSGRSISVSDRCRPSDRSTSGSWRLSGRSISNSDSCWLFILIGPSTVAAVECWLSDRSISRFCRPPDRSFSGGSSCRLSDRSISTSYRLSDMSISGSSSGKFVSLILYCIFTPFLKMVYINRASQCNANLCSYCPRRGNGPSSATSSTVVCWISAM